MTPPIIADSVQFPDSLIRFRSAREVSDLPAIPRTLLIAESIEWDSHLVGLQSIRYKF